MRTNAALIEAARLILAKQNPPIPQQRLIVSAHPDGFQVEFQSRSYGELYTTLARVVRHGFPLVDVCRAVERGWVMHFRESATV